MTALRTLALGLAVAAVGLSCGDRTTEPPISSPPPPPPVTNAVVSLATPNADDGALILTLRGPNATAIQLTNSGHILYSRAASSSELRVTIVGDLMAGSLVTFTLASGQSLASYSAAVDQVASRSDVLRSSTSGYALTVAAAP